MSSRDREYKTSYSNRRKPILMQFIRKKNIVNLILFHFDINQSNYDITKQRQKEKKILDSISM